MGLDELESDTISYEKDREIEDKEWYNVCYLQEKHIS